MRYLLALALVPLLLAGCTDTIPYKDDFGTSALRPKGNIPPEFAAFNNYSARTNGLLASQICATRYARLDEKSVPAVPGEIIAWRGRCQIFESPLYRLAEHVVQ